MASRREEVLAALAAVITTALAGVDVVRNLSKAVTAKSPGLVIIRDGDPGEPEVTMGVVSYTYRHRIPLEVAAPGTGEATRRALLDDLLVRICLAVTANRTLDGRADYVEPEAPSFDDLNITGSDPVAWADLAIVAEYTTSTPLT